jgi:hypothetical protein
MDENESNEPWQTLDLVRCAIAVALLAMTLLMVIHA